MSQPQTTSRSVQPFLQSSPLYPITHTDHVTCDGATSGIKQGGIISPVPFCIYIDDLVVRLSLSGIGWYIGLTFSGDLAYADDIVLIAPTVCYI